MCVYVCVPKANVLMCVYVCVPKVNVLMCVYVCVPVRVHVCVFLRAGDNTLHNENVRGILLSPWSAVASGELFS